MFVIYFLYDFNELYIFLYYSLCASKLVKTMKRVTRSMSKAARESDDVKPDDFDLISRKVNKNSGTEQSRFSQAQTFQSMQERTVDGKVYGAENDISMLQYIKKETNDSSQIKQCQCQIDLRLSKP